MELHCALNNPFGKLCERRTSLNHAPRIFASFIKRELSTHAGANPVGDFSIAPITRNGVSSKVKGVSNSSGSLMHGYGFVHSVKQILPMRYKNNTTIMYAAIRCSQTLFEKGPRKDTKLGGALVGFL